MLKNIANFFHKKKKNIEDEIILKLEIDKTINVFVKKEILNNKNLDYKLSYSLNRGVIKLETENKIIAQEIALRIRLLENELKNRGVKFKKLLI